MAKKYVYYFGDGLAEGTSNMKELLGGKGAGLAEMTNLGISVPPGFTISTEACVEYLQERETVSSRHVGRRVEIAQAGRAVDGHGVRRS